MKRSALAVALLCVIASGCGENRQSNSAEADPGVLVSDFASPDLQGLVVRDHPNGAEVVTAPDEELTRAALENEQAPFPMSMFYTRGAVLTAVNDTPVRDAAHFRELANGAAQRGEPLRVSMQQP
jgi:hypothetical protein